MPAPATTALDVARPTRPRDRAFWTLGAVLFLATAWGTISWCGSMAGGMPMPGGWTMSMAWMRMPGQTWIGAAAMFLGMWILMMAAMMLPSLLPMLARYRRSLREVGETRLAAPTAIAGSTYLLVWTFFGAGAYPIGIALAAAEMRWPAVARQVPLATGVVLLAAGVFQVTKWKSRRLEECRVTAGCCTIPAPDARSAIRSGLRMGFHCVLCCLGLMSALLALGVMDLGAMAVVAAAITAERVLPWPRTTSRAIGVLLAAAGALEVVAAVAPGFTPPL